MVFFPKRIFDLNSILDISLPDSRKKKRVVLFDELLKISSLRLYTFKEKGITCCSCAREGSHFRLQKTDRERIFHLGLWSDDGIEMTKDHIVPKSFGGYDHIDNMQTMCEECNVLKSNYVTEKDYQNGYFKKGDNNV